jgi:heme O synthase-like polyprenyltransferase
VGHTDVSSEARPAFYALRPGGWRDYLTLLHPPYTLWHLSYVAIGAALAPQMKWGTLGWTVLAFLLALGIGAHALDELSGRPLQTQIPRSLLVVLAALSIGAACAIGIVVASDSTWWLLLFVVMGAFMVVAYNLELFGGTFHSNTWFAIAWGAFPVLTGYFASAERLRSEAVLAAAFAVFASLAQRTLSTQVRFARREAGDPEAARPAEVALQLLAVALPLLAGALLLARSG